MAVVAAATLLFASCSVHEWPYEEVEPELPKYPLTLHLNYLTELPQYVIVDYEVSRSDAQAEAEAEPAHDRRYTLEVYKIINEYTSKKELVLRDRFTEAELNPIDKSLTIELTEGKHEFHVWTDYVDPGTSNDKYYNADNFSAIVITQHVGNTDHRDAFVGHLTADVTELTTDLYVDNVRPLAKFNFIATDLDEFVKEMAKVQQKENGSSEIDLNDYRIMFRYSQNMPSEYDHFLDMPVDIMPSVRWESKIRTISETEAEIGFDYVFTNNSDFPTPISVEVYDKTGNMISAVNDIPVPLKRGELTTIRGRFLTQEASGGIGIDPDFEDPDYIYIVP